MTNFTRLSLAFCIFFTISSLQLYATIFYVKPVATGTGTGASWTNAAGSVQAMINAAVAGDEIWVAAGSYLPTQDGAGNTGAANSAKTFNLKNGVKMYGGFAGTETSIALRPALSLASISTLSGDFNNDDVITGTGPSLSITNQSDNALHVVLSVNDANSTLLDGFTVSGGYAWTGSNQTIEGQVIVPYQGGGMYNKNSSAIITNCEFKGNRSLHYGGGMYNNQASVSVSNSSFLHNYASLAPALFNEGSSISVTNSVIVGNLGEGIIANAFGGTSSYRSCTVMGNGSTSYFGSNLSNSTNPIFVNCILWNAAGNITTEDLSVQGGNPSYSYCIVKGGLNGTAMSSADPEFINAASPAGPDGLLRTSDDGIRLADCSAGYNAGTNTNAPATDVIGTSRPQFGTVDIGAYESMVVRTIPPVLRTAVSSFSCTATTLLATGGDSYEWSGGATPTAAENTFTSNGNYTITTTNADGCTDDTIILVALAPDINFSGDTAGCSVAILTASGAVSYLWTGGNTPQDATNTFKQSGTYSVTATAANNCTSTRSQIVTVTISPRLYVNGAVAVSGDGSAWSTAFKTVQEAINVCGVQDVWVAAGKYVPTTFPAGIDTNDTRNKTFYLVNGIKLYGGFNGTETLLSARNINANLTTLSGDLAGDDNGFTGNSENAYHVLISVADDSSTLVNGFTIQGGNASNYDGFQLENNYINSYYGGGMVHVQSAASLIYCTFLANNAIYGGGMSIDNSPMLIDNCTFINNSSNDGGGGLYSNYGESRVTIINSVFSGNTGYNGGAIKNSGNLSLINCTIANNTASDRGAGVFDENYNSPTVVRNCNIWGNIGSENAGFIDQGQTPDITYSNIQGNMVYTGTGNILADPLFVNASLPLGSDGFPGTADDGLALQNTSPLLDAGTNTGSGTPLLDINGNGIYNLTKDMGAYEQMEGQAVFAGSSACESVTINNISGNQWYYFRSAGSIIAAINPNGIDMGSVTASIGDTSAPVRYNGRSYTSRSISFASSNYGAGTTMPGNCSIRLYNSDSEMIEYNSATNGSYTIADLNIDWYQGGNGCMLSGYEGNADGTINAASIQTGEYGANNNGFFMQFEIDHFTIFAAGIPAAVLPVKLVSIAAVNKGSFNMVSWATATETNNKNFNVQRSADGVTFYTLTRVPGAINSNTLKSYQYKDSQPLAGINYYRLQQEDVNGRVYLSAIVSAKFTGIAAISISPNPVQGQLFVKGIQPNTVYEITTAIGQKVSAGIAVAGLPINTSGLQRGIYFISINGEVIKFVKQ